MLLIIPKLLNLSGWKLNMDKYKNIPKIYTRYKGFSKENRDIWESFCLIDFYAPKIKDAIKNDVFPQLSFDRLKSTTDKVSSKKNIYGALASLSSKGNYRRTLLEAVLTFEDYITDIIKIVYLDIPTILLRNQSNNSNSSGYKNLLELVLKANDKEDIVNKLVEEKIRSIFYGNPLDIFEKDKAHLGLGSYFKDNHSNDLKTYRKIIAIRNIIAHNNGKVDSKYIREVDSTVALGRKVVIDREFLKETIYLLSMLATQLTRLVIENIYKENAKGKLAQPAIPYRN